MEDIGTEEDEAPMATRSPSCPRAKVTCQQPLSVTTDASRVASQHESCVAGLFMFVCFR